LGNGLELFGTMLAEIRARGEILAEQTVGVFVAAALLRVLRVGEVDRETGVDPKLRVLRHRGPLVRGQ
tara:strand:+ start:3726 stop:3929 length:204 start_codon:yes stop_codon:yes gene_type:complete